MAQLKNLNTHKIALRSQEENGIILAKAYTEFRHLCGQCQSVSSPMYAFKCVLSIVCSQLCALICVLSYVCSPICSHMCALIWVLSYVCSHLCALLYAHISYVCSRISALICVLSFCNGENMNCKFQYNRMNPNINPRKINIYTLYIFNEWSLAYFCVALRADHDASIAAALR